ncbi:MAG: hypothetical protein QGG60_03990 [Anaerolineales bacterium]|nr:hypothetical protein [Anaerolineales bacterium]
MIRFAPRAREGIDEYYYHWQHYYDDYAGCGTVWPLCMVQPRVGPG